MVDKDVPKIEVPAGEALLAGLIERTARFWVAMGNIESRYFVEELEEIHIKQPIYVSGLARSGSTLLLELINSKIEIASQQYRDYPPVYTPVWWNWFLDHMPRKTIEPAERSHKDGILVTPDSPEAIEEVIWMKFFPNSHNSAVSNIISHTDRNEQFEKFENFYDNHLRKILLVRRGKRYLSKGNYNVTRLKYLLSLYPDAKFVIPIREPQSHIASLMKQHRLFMNEEQRDQRILKYMNRIGHYEFGLNRRAINVGNDVAAEIERHWGRDEEVIGWAKYWSSIYGYLWSSVNKDEKLRNATLFVRFEDLCKDPAGTIKSMFSHCHLELTDEQLHVLASRPKAPTYYESGLTGREQELIEAETETVRLAFDY